VQGKKKGSEGNASILEIRGKDGRMAVYRRKIRKKFFVGRTGNLG